MTYSGIYVYKTIKSGGLKRIKSLRFFVLAGFGIGSFVRWYENRKMMIERKRQVLIFNFS